jgi:hypothetical protein
MYWGRAKTEVNEEDWMEYERLTQAGTAESILELPDYYGFVALTAFSGTVLKGMAGARYGSRTPAGCRSMDG